VTLERLWAGWRSDYVASVSSAPPTTGGAAEAERGERPAECVFCAIAAAPEPDEVRFVVHEGELAMSLLNAYPYASGHVLVMPVRHVAEPEELSAEESAALWSEMQTALRAVRGAYGPDGVNLGANLGRAGGAGIPGHLHFHVLPRWIGDTNFMTTIASVRVLPEALSESFRKLRASWPE
jgi:ATP adenylyltransferase